MTKYRTFWKTLKRRKIISWKSNGKCSLLTVSKTFPAYLLYIPMPFRSIPFQFAADMLKALINHTCAYMCANACANAANVANVFGGYMFLP